MHLGKIALCAVCVVSIAGILSGAAFAQPPENHYKTYNVLPPFPLQRHITLIDQFLAEQVMVVGMEKFSTPVEKNGEPMVDPRVHMTWWRIDPLEPFDGGIVDVVDQFGFHRWDFGDAEYLLNPASKNNPGPIPPWNHYKCYKVVGAMAVNRDVTLLDQFGFTQVHVLEPLWFCNPVEKILENGEISPIIDPQAHLSCYRIDDPQQYDIPIVFYDQFVVEQVILRDADCLCLPADKEGVIGTETTSWGRVKALFD